MTKHSELPIRVGVFSHIAHADRAVERLLAAGFERAHITVICPTCTVSEFPKVKHEESAGTHAPAAAASGGVIGAVLGGLVAVSVVATGGLSLLAVGPLVVGLGGGAVAGGLIGAMMSRGFDDERANFYDQAVQKGSILVAVEEHDADAAQRLEEAERIFEASGVEPISLPVG